MNICFSNTVVLRFFSLFTLAHNFDLPPTYCSANMAVQAISTDEGTSAGRISLIRKLLKPKKNRRITKKVRFHPTVLMKPIFKVDEWMKLGVDPSDLWYTPKDYKRMRLNDKISVLMQKQDKILQDDISYCFRGLEQRSFVAGFEKTKIKFLGVLTVLLEQDRQHVEYDPNIELLADRYYNNVSYDSQMEALQRGLDDEQEAFRLYRGWNMMKHDHSYEVDDLCSIDLEDSPTSSMIPVTHSSTFLAAQMIAMWESASSPSVRAR
jgi:hypothetical protein